ATGSDTSQKENTKTGDNWRRLSTSSPSPRPATSGDLKNGARHHLATSTQNRVF
ncbi:hypothetical protein A2U01_0111638, partial [Trifolium medium]|nr:hypothetical protein [Trifolium medium]